MTEVLQSCVEKTVTVCPVSKGEEREEKLTAQKEYVFLHSSVDPVIVSCCLSVRQSVTIMCQ